MEITDVHAVLHTHAAEADRTWLADILGLEGVGRCGRRMAHRRPAAGGACGAPGSERGRRVELYLMCDDIETTVQELRDKGVAFDGSLADQSWGRVTKVVLPSGGRLGLYEPRHAGPLPGIHAGHAPGMRCS